MWKALPGFADETFKEGGNCQGVRRLGPYIGIYGCDFRMEIAQWSFDPVGGVRDRKRAAFRACLLLKSKKEQFSHATLSITHIKRQA